MRIRTVVAASAALALAPAAVSAHHQPGHQGGNQNNVTIGATSPITWGGSTVITGKLQGPDSGAVAVDLEADAYPFNDTEFAKTAEAITDANGDFRVEAQPQLNTRYRVVAKASPPVTSEPATVLVRLRVTRSVSDKTPAMGARVRFRGKVCPEHDGKTALVQRRTSSGYRTVGRATLQDIAGDPCSSYSRRVRIRRDGVYRVRVPSGDADHSPGVSRRVRIDAH
jgi:hypothetical protein